CLCSKEGLISRTSASREKLSIDGISYAAEHFVEQGEWQTDHVEVASVNSFHISRGESLNGVGPSLVKRFTAFEVAFNFQLRQRTELHLCLRDPQTTLTVLKDTQAG